MLRSQKIVLRWTLVVVSTMVAVWFLPAEAQPVPRQEQNTRLIQALEQQNRALEQHSRALDENTHATRELTQALRSQKSSF